MAEDRPANDDGEGVDAAVGLTADAFADMVRLLRLGGCDGEANI
jgi:hypothetical protein